MNKKANLKQLRINQDNELFSKINNIRVLIEDSHWHSDGIYKEILLKKRLLKKLANSEFTVGSGFIINAENNNVCEKQIDILIFEKEFLFEIDDFYVVDVKNVRAVIEVKTRIENSSEFMEVIKETNKIWQWLFKNSNDLRNHFVGIFSYEGYEQRIGSKNLVSKLKTVFHNEMIKESLLEKGSKFVYHLVNLNRDILIERKSIELVIYEYQQQAYSYFINTLCDWLRGKKYIIMRTIGDRLPNTISPLYDERPIFKLSLSEHWESNNENHQLTELCIEKEEEKKED